MPPKGSRKSAATTPNKTLVLDNGAYTLKAGLVPANANPTYDDCTVTPNCIARSTRDKRTYMSSELASCKDFGELAFRRPVEKGFIVNWEAEKAIWEHEFLGAAAGEGLRCDPKETNLLLTEKPNCPKELQKNCDEIVFEQFEFAAYYRCVGPTLNAYNATNDASLSSLPQECLLIIDTSYSDTTILPLYNGRLIQSAVRRLTVGGKLLTNYLKELSSLRHYNMMEETYLLNEIKEAVSYVSPSPQQYAKDLERTWKGRLGDKRALDSSIVMDYVLPDYEKSIHGYARPHDAATSGVRRGLQPLQGPREDVLPLGNERFAVPELLFNPSDIGIREAGLAGATMESLSALPEALKVGLLANVVVVGGNSLISGFLERLEAELRSLVPAGYLLKVAPISSISTPMRRIPRPLRALEPSHAFCPSASARQQLSPWSCAHLQTTSPAFSTTASRSFLLPGKQDKKKHQQFVRRWQKRLLGDSEPIGAHVDPYDPTSPVRIAPEEQGEYEEVLAEDRLDDAEFPLYTPAEKSSRLLRVGGEQWLKQKLEGDMAKEFEKLTLRTYTPLTLDMANDVEELTGTPYTLKDENLLMAQTVHDLTGRPYTKYNFGLHKKTTSARELRSRFAQAVAEVYALKQAGRDMDISKFPNRGVYDPPRWVKDIKLSRTDSGELALAFPRYKSAEQLLQAMQAAPEWESAQADEELLIDEAAHLQEQEPVMDPDTPAFKRAAVVKMDAEKKPFDFMSNRPVPRAKPIQKANVDEVAATQEPALSEQTPAPSPLAELTSAIETSQSAISQLCHSVIEHRAQRLTDDILALRKAAKQDKSDSVAPKIEDAKWRHVPITDLAIKFALFKRLLQLTGLRISDPQLTSTKTLGDLYGYLCAAAKPQTTSLFSAIHLEGQKARERAKQQSSVPDALSRRRADLGDLINLGNVELRRVKATKTEKRTKTGLDKVVQYALWERGLGGNKSSTSAKHGKSKPRILEGTRQAPAFGKPMSGKGATFLAKKTSEWKVEQERQARASIV
ncbi:actin-domain-containing protein [Cucurbitaria berberidis CBS 394.84]|uniref:Actin-like protein ARP6 n=1 Tax=Cucurbitaria berberidis CBS 394.84 TaxID=1168544 RepID=A0A9P4GB41_9PLEO|nr:actin-domain-containing protein [Cucurbitaria berberidis CBS 394.84]KAF1842548.1 actin-domain-containing protein [Cucurbitaria berberidis CBS 394.84]